MIRRVGRRVVVTVPVPMLLGSTSFTVSDTASLP